jgi:hypothetical protein
VSMIRKHVFHGDNPIGRAVGLALFLLPLEYVAEILSTAVHEILGHGLSAVVLGGTFSGFIFRWDGMGWAFCGLPSTAPLTHEVLQLASGIIAEVTCGVALWGVIAFFWRRRDIQLVLLMASFTFLIDGASYVLWNAYRPVPPGDIGRIIWLASPTWPPEASVLRWTLLVVGALLCAATTLYFYPALFVRIEALIVPGNQLAGGPRLLALLVFLVLPGCIGWLLFDWNQVAPGIGWLPCAVGVLSVVVMGGLLFWCRPRFKGSDSARLITRRHIAVAWTGLTVTALPLTLWFNEGVRWGSEEETIAPRIVGPFALSNSGAFLFCGVERDRTDCRYVVIPLRDEYQEPVVLSFPDSDKCHGAMWRPGADPDELLFATAGEAQVIKQFRVSGSGVEETSSYPVDSDLRVTMQSLWWNPSGDAFALRVTQFEKGVFSGAYLGFSKDCGKTIFISTIPAPSQLLWVTDTALYLTHAPDANTVVLSRAELHTDDMKVATHEILQGKLLVATQCLHGGLVYATGNTLFRESKVLTVLPEETGRPVVDGDYLAVASANGKRLYILDDTGKVVDMKEMPNSPVCIGISAANKSIYLAASSPEARKRICAYNFVEKSERIIIEASDVFSKRFRTIHEQ